MAVKQFMLQPVLRTTDTATAKMMQDIIFINNITKSSSTFTKSLKGWEQYAIQISSWIIITGVKRSLYKSSSWLEVADNNYSDKHKSMRNWYESQNQTSNCPETTSSLKQIKPHSARRGTQQKNTTLMQFTANLKWFSYKSSKYRLSQTDGQWHWFRNCHSGWQRITYLALGLTWQMLIILAPLSNRLSPVINSQQSYEASISRAISILHVNVHI